MSGLMSRSHLFDIASAGRLPSFLIIGAVKCGTTSLHAWLSAHPEVFMHPWKEMRFFTEHWQRGPDWYRAQFAGAGSGQAAGEASNAYTRHPHYPDAARRIASLMPEARLVYLVRDPMRRLESHYRHRLATGWEWREFDRAVREDPAYIESGLYGAQLQRYLDYFDRSQILVLRAEKLFAEPAPHLERLADFLGVARRPDLPLAAENVTGTRVVVPAALRQLNRFAPTRALARRLIRQLRRSPLIHQRGRSAANMPFALDPTLRAKLERIYAKDAGRLATLGLDASITSGNP